MSRYASVAVSGPLKRSFVYRVPGDVPELEPGQRVLVPFGRTRKIGFFLSYTKPPSDIAIKDIQRVLDPHRHFSDELFKFCLWVSDYYFANAADCLLAALPPFFKAARGPDYYWSSTGCDFVPEDLKPSYKPDQRLTKASIKKIVSAHRGLMPKLIERAVVIERWPAEKAVETRPVLGFRAGNREVWHQHFAGRRRQHARFDGVKSRSLLRADGWTDYYVRKAISAGVLEPVYADEAPPLLDFIQPKADLHDISLTPEQQRVVGKVGSRIGRGFQSFLLHGVTGSGKTIVYCHLCREVTGRGGTALVLVPEIALTSTTLAYLRGFFGDQVTAIHSAMTDTERLESWRGIKQGRFSIVVGPRSAVFAPLANIGVIIVDEEHDGSYKQNDPAPRFHGRDAAIMRAKMNGIPIVLGSASPSLESFHHAKQGQFRLLTLTQRPGGAVLPTVRIVDMKEDRLRGDLPFMSYALKKSVEVRLQKKEQVILYLNRRGHSPQLKCHECGLVSKCPNCQVNLTYHRVGGKLSCHYCGYLLNRYDSCPRCASRDFLYQGVGTQKVEENIPRLFKDARAVRFDSDTASGRKRAYQILTEFSAHKSHILLGTQMVTKGLDLPHVTLVGVLSADQSLEWPDFRASEKSFARLLQVAGRSGRSENPGEVLIQTYQPEHQVISDAARQDYEGFFDREIVSRRELSYPPFARIVNFVISAPNEQILQKAALDFRDRLLQMVERSGLRVGALGPAPCAIYRLRNRYRRHLFVKTGQIVKFVRALTEWELREPRFKLPSSVRVAVDVDPDDMM